MSKARRMISRAAFHAALLYAAGLRAASGQTPSPQELTELLRRRWESIQTIEYTCEERRESVNGRRPELVAYMRYETSHERGGLTSYAATSVAHSGPPRTIVRLIEDGKRRYGYTYLNTGDGEVLSSVTIRNQESIDSGLSNTAMMSATWLTTPGGEPLHEYAGRAISIKPVEADGRRQIEMIFPYESAKLRCLLDPEHDWLASSMEFLDDERTTWRVEAYQRDNGRWFPAAGKATATLAGNYAESRFEITNLKINQAIPPSRFTPLSLPKGAVVEDVGKGTRFVWQGTPATRLEFLKRHAPKGSPPAVEDSPDPLIVETEPDERNWGLAIASASTVVLAIGGLLRVFRRA